MKYPSESFIAKSKKIHNDKYDYSLVDYVNAKTKVKIICPIHGIFEQLPNNYKNNCPKCSVEKITFNTFDFIERSKELHKNKYDYSLVEYKNALTKVKIICSIHGVFEQKPCHHFNGHGCKKCSDSENGYNKRYNIKEFIGLSIKVHGDKYDYSLVKYVDSLTKVKIICSIHGIFEQTPNSHINSKQGCPKCANKVITLNEFIIKSNKAHNYKYDYSLSDYKNYSTKVNIICPNHGVFEQSPSDHIRGIGCPKCTYSKSEKSIKEFFDKNDIEYITQKTFEGCKYKRSLYFDFYLPMINTCIEYDGEQHFMLYNFEKDDNDLKIRQLRDKIKTDYCLNNNIRLIRIKYNQNIIDVLTNELPL